MLSDRKKRPDFFNGDGLDPVEIATGYAPSPPDNNTSLSENATQKVPTAEVVVKKKAGFYLSMDLLNRFNLKFHELKLAGVPVDNKSTLIEVALGFALDDMDKGASSQVLNKLDGPK